MVTIANRLSINIISNAAFIESKGIDSYVAYVITDKNDTFFIEYGSKGVIDDLHYGSPTVFPLNQKESITKSSGKEPSSDEILFSEYPEEDREQNIFDKNYFLYDSISKMIVKIVQPKRIGDGCTGLYIPILQDGKSFSIYAIDLDSSTHYKALQMFRSIRYLDK